MSLAFFISLFDAQHVSDVNTSILRSLRLICQVISWVEIKKQVTSSWSLFIQLSRWCTVQ